jgi:signal transduction histidine kinase
LRVACAAFPKGTLITRLRDEFSALYQDEPFRERRTLGETAAVKSRADSDLWQVEVDPSQLQNAILNLAINARDAMPTGGKLTITAENAHLDTDYARLHPEVRGGRYVLIAVTDTGTGMPKELLERATEPFFTTKEVAPEAASACQ